MPRMVVVLALLTLHRVERLVIGLPLGLDGREGTAARRVRAFARRLKEKLAAQGRSLPIHAYDERFSTAQAEGALRQGDIRRDRRKAIIDAVAAQLILQSWLDQRRRPERE